jgi:DNA polymerase elongation subunit (family B)
MSYVDAFYDREQDMIRVVERNDKGERIFKEHPARHVFYYPDTKGKYQSIKGEPLTRVSSKNVKEHRKELAIYSGKKLYESDINPIYRCLEDNYLNQDAPKLNVAFWDIEVDFDPERGYASPDDAFMPITAIAIYLQWMETMVCLAIPPKTLSMEEAKRAVEEFPNTMLFDNEADMLDTFLDLIQDADILSGWNSEGFDMPYTVNRIIKVLSKEDTRRLCLWNQFPKKREYEKYGKAAVTYDLIGRVHLDSLELYRKYTYEERHTYRLDAIGEMEIGENKTVYEGTLDQLYNNDFKTFIAYNRQDTALLDKLDKKLKFLDLANTLAHECTVLLQTTMGAVAVTEQAIVNEAHRRGMIVPNRVQREEGFTNQAAGAYVAYPKKGIHEWIGSLDINSLYPSAIRALNMGPETIVGQLRQDGTKDYIAAQLGKGKSFAAAWEGMFGAVEYTSVMNKEVGREITIDWENGGSDTLSAAQCYDLIFDSNQPWMISANGTIFTYETEGIIPGLLKRWYADRKEMQAKLKECIAAGNKIEEEYWDKRQLVKKINLNSLYGAILNPGCRFFDNRIGQSTTLTGRAIAQHMAGKVNEIITGEFNHTGKAIIYGDSVTGDTMILTKDGDITIKQLFDRCLEHSIVGDKEYGVLSPDKVMGFNSFEDSTVMAIPSYVMRHKTKKRLYQINLQNGKSVKVTEDHSIMVDRDGFLIEVRPTEIRDTDLFICLKR